MRLGLLLALVLSLAAEARAEWQVKPFVGMTFGGSSNLITDLNGALGKRKALVGISVMRIGEIFGFEGDLGYRAGFFGTTPTILNSSLTTLTGNVIVALPRRMSEYTLRPYFVGGGGMIRPSTTTFGNVLELSTPLAAIDIGGGVSGNLTRSLGVSWDLRRFQSVRGSTADPASTVDGLGQRISFWRANMALAIRF